MSTNMWIYWDDAVMGSCVDEDWDNLDPGEDEHRDLVPSKLRRTAPTKAPKATKTRKAQRTEGEAWISSLDQQATRQ